MSNNVIIRKAFLELTLTPNKEVVKVAGILRRLQNVFRKLTDSQYADAVDALQTDSYGVQSVSRHLSKKINDLLSSIKDGDVDTYDFHLSEVRELTTELVKELEQLNRDGQKIKRELRQDTFKSPEAPSEKTPAPSLPNGPASPEAPRVLNRINRKDWEDRKLRNEIHEKAKERLKDKEGYPYGENLNIPYSSVPALLDKKINYSEPFLKLFVKKISETISLTFDSKDISLENVINSKFFVSKLPEDITRAILENGIIIRAKQAAPDTGGKVTNRDLGEINLRIKTTIDLPLLKKKLSAIVELVDLNPASKNRISAKNIYFGKDSFSWDRDSRIAELKKLAFSNSERPYQVTNLSDLEFANILAEGYRMAFGSPPTLEVLGGAWAQCSLESGRPVKLPNNNIGNVKATGEWITKGNPYFIKGTKEVDKEGKEYAYQAKWRAFNSPEEGAAAYWKLIGGRYKDAMAWMASGDPVTATVIMGQKHYYTANIEKYSGAVGSLYKEFLTKLAPKIAGVKSAPTAAPSTVKPEVKDPRFSSNKPVSSSSAPSSSGQTDSSADQLLKELFASSSVTKLVKNALADDSKKSQLLVSLANLSAPFAIRYRYATALKKSLAELLDSEVNVFTDGNKIELETSTIGSPYSVQMAITALAESVSSALAAKTAKLGSYQIGFKIIPNTLSKYGKQ